MATVEVAGGSALKAVVPPLTEASALVSESYNARVPPVWSHARKVRPLEARVVPSGTKRTLSVPFSSTALESETAPTSLQSASPTFMYWNLPPPVTVVPVMAMPSTAPLSTSVIWPPSKLARSETRSPSLS